jgi:uncharacterized protein YlxP (DUF503 family)
MVIGLATVELHIPESNSLKDKRQVLKSLLETTRQKFNVSAAEVDDLDIWRRATIAFACVSKDQSFANQVLDKVIDLIESNPRVHVAEIRVEFL